MSEQPRAELLLFHSSTVIHSTLHIFRYEVKLPNLVQEEKGHLGLEHVARKQYSISFLVSHPQQGLLLKPAGRRHLINELQWQREVQGSDKPARD